MVVTGQSSNSAPGRVKGILNQSVYLKKRFSTSYSGQELTEIFAVPSLYVYVALAINYYYGIIYIELNLSGCCTNYNANFEIEWLCSCVSSLFHCPQSGSLSSGISSVLACNCFSATAAAIR